MLQFPASPTSNVTQTLTHHQRRNASLGPPPQTTTTTSVPLNKRHRRHSFTVLPNTTIDVRKNPKPYLGSFDFDQTLVKWLTQPDGIVRINDPYDEALFLKNAAAIKQLYPSMATEINSGRNLAGMQAAAKILGKNLDKLPVDYLHLVDGDQHYVNDRHLPTSEWIEKLTEQDREMAWETQTPMTKGATWDTETVRNAIQNLLSKANYQLIKRKEASNGNVATYFEKRNPQTLLKVNLINYGKNEFILSFKLKPIAQKPQSQEDVEELNYNQALIASEFKKLLAQYFKMHGIKAFQELADSQDPKTGAITERIILTPYTTNKTMSIQGTLNRYMTNPQAVITGGDSPLNDQEALSSTLYKHQAKEGLPLRYIPNYPIISGNDEHVTSIKTLKEAVQEKVPAERIQQVATGELGSAIHQQIHQAQIDHKTKRNLNYVI